MTQNFRTAVICLAFTSFCLLAQTTSHAQLVTTVTPVVTPTAGGDFTYSYTVTTSPTSPVDAGALYIDVASDADLQSIMAPTGYDILYTPGPLPDPSNIEFASTDASDDITPGNSAMFSFVSAIPPGLVDDATQSFDDGSFDSGTTLGPVDLPEPASIGFIAVGAACFTRRPRKI